MNIYFKKTAEFRLKVNANNYEFVQPTANYYIWLQVTACQASRDCNLLQVTESC